MYPYVLSTSHSRVLASSWYAYVNFWADYYRTITVTMNHVLITTYRLAQLDRQRCHRLQHMHQLAVTMNR